MAKKKSKVDIRALCTGIICITLLEALALFMGYNGTLLKFVLVLIGLAIGVAIPNPFKK